ncbi:deoxynucleotidyltransferase terminal-interacting protein 2 [Trichechus manatus latirostris]|uniref:Deoxynucleotidyltransferase terminal-interacting protein 2 n=1 Tax=Trichechus manatus latirostris TaxID=127582 RepID=A0A2Y9DPY1_TRIMA|nr:deoxynucleotidyltransferase terminal-interacting protein 2 [Trichechus manatus latirostris]
MVLTRSARPQARIQATSAERSQQKNSAADGIKECPESRKESQSDDRSTAESHTTWEHSPVPRTPKTRKRKSRIEGSLPEMIEPSADGETSEAESNCSSVSELQDPIVRVTRRRQILVSRTPVSSVRKRLKITPISESHSEEEVSEAESHVSGISTFVPSTVITTRARRREAKPSQESHAEDISDAESSCSDISSFSGIAVRRATRSMHRKLQAQTEEKDTKIILGKEKWNCKGLDEKAKGIINKGKEINDKSSQLNSLSELQDASLQQLVSQKHSTPQSNKTTREPSNLNYEAVMKSLAQTFAVVEVDRWDEERKSTIKTSDSTQFGDDEECTIISVSKDMNNKKNVNLECDTTLCNPELNTSQDKGDSVLLVLSSDESQQSENSENEEDTVCFVENSGRRESSNGDLGNMSCDTALFVIDTTPGLSADKNFYLEEEDKASEAATEEEKEEGEDEKSEEPSDHDVNKDNELSDEEDLLNSTKSKLLKLTSSSIDPGLSIKELGGLYINFNADKLQSNKRTLTQIKEKTKNDLLQKTIITPDFEKNYSVPPYRESKFQLQKKRREERQKTAGNGWFGMKAPELTDELKNDLKALKMRASMDPKRFYKKNDRDGFPKYFQIGTIVDNPADFYHSRIPKKERKRTIVEELLADSEFRRYNRRKYSEIMAEKAANAAGKKFRKKKKFRN